MTNETLKANLKKLSAVAVVDLCNLLSDHDVYLVHSDSSNVSALVHPGELHDIFQGYGLRDRTGRDMLDEKIEEVTKAELDPMSCAGAVSQWLTGNPDYAWDAYAADNEDEAAMEVARLGGSCGGHLHKISMSDPAEAERLARLELGEMFDEIYASVSGGA